MYIYIASLINIIITASSIRVYLDFYDNMFFFLYFRFCDFNLKKLSIWLRITLGLPMLIVTLTVW